MNQQQEKYDRTLYTRDPFVYIGFNHEIEEESKTKDEEEKTRVEKEEKKVEEGNLNKGLIGKKRMPSSHKKEFLIDCNKNGANEDNKRITNANINNKGNSKSIQEMRTLEIKKEIKINSQLISEKTVESECIYSRDEAIQSTKQTETKSDPKKVEKKLDKRIENNKTNKRIPNNLHNANNEKNKINPQVIKNENELSKKLLIDNIFASGIDLDFKPKKKEEVVQRQAIEKFNSSYKEFLIDARFYSVTKRINRLYHSNNSTTLYHLFKFIKDNGGIENVIGHNLLQTFLHQKRLYPDTKAAKNDFDIYLFHYSLYLENKDKLTEKIVQRICEKDSSVLMECRIIEAYEGDSEEVINEKIKEGLKCDMVILRGFLKNFQLNNSLFTLENLESNFNLKNHIDVVEQEKDFFGFLPNRHLRKKMNLGDYIKYVRSFQDGSVANSKAIKTKSTKEKLLYGVNVELTEYLPLLNELENKLNPLILFGSSYDTLSYVRNHIKGMTIPQMYVKVPGVWTGGHEENLRMRSINICHGPGSSYWWATPTGDSQKLVDKVKDKYKINIYKKEGIWFPNIDFFFDNNIKVLYTLQQSGDIVLVGSGTIHWVRAKDHSINTSWNFSAKEVFDLQSSMARYEINKEIKIRSLVPMKTLIMDVLNVEMFNLSLDYVNCCANYIIPSITESITKLNAVKEEFQNSSGKYNIGIFKEEEMYMVETCEMCLCEVFNLWAFCQVCSKAKEQFIVCLSCFRSHLSHCYNPKLQFIFYKYEAKEMLRFLDRLNFRLKYDNQMECKELNEPQLALQKCTKDNKSITEKMKFKIIHTDDFLHLKEYYYLYKNLDTNEISSLLIPLIDPEKYSSEDFRMPLKSSKENFIDPYIDYEDLYYEESNKQRFSPTNARIKSNNDDDINFNYVFTGDDLNANNDYKNNLFELNSNNGKIQSMNSSIRMSPRNNIKTKFNSNLPGRAFFEDVDVPDTFDVRSNQGGFKNDSNKILCPSSPRQSNIFSLVSDVHRMKKLKNDLCLLNEQPAETDVKINSEDFCVMDVFNGMFSSSNNNERRNPDEKKNSIEDIKIAKSLLSDLTGKDAVSKYKFISNIHTNIWKGKELILRHIDNKEICELTKLRAFVERIISNSFLITAYREIFRDEIYDRMR